MAIPTIRRSTAPQPTQPPIIPAVAVICNHLMGEHQQVLSELNRRHPGRDIRVLLEQEPQSALIRLGFAKRCKKALGSPKGMSTVLIVVHEDCRLCPALTPRATASERLARHLKATVPVFVQRMGSWWHGCRVEAIAYVWKDESKMERLSGCTARSPRPSWIPIYRRDEM